MSHLRLSSTILGSEGCEDEPSWENIKCELSKLKDSKGSVRLSFIDPPEIGAEGVSVRAENNFYLVTMVVNISENEDEVRSYANNKIGGGMSKVEILGDLWDPFMLMEDINLVIDLFKEFYVTGSISKIFLS